MRNQGFSVRLNGILGFVFLIGMLVLLFFIARGIFNLLAIASPFLFGLALLINYRTVINYFRFLGRLFQRSILSGIIAVILSIVGYPVLSFILFGKSILDRKVRKLQKAYQQDREGELVEYEEVTRPDDESLDLPPLEKRTTQNKENPYQDLF